MKEQIKMKPGYDIKNGVVFENDNSILVDNYDGINMVINLPIRLENLSSYGVLNSIGIWKIKKTNN